MGGTLEALGRTNTLSSNANTLLGNAINIRQMQNQEARDANSQAIDLKRLSMDEKAAGELSAARIEEMRIRKAQEERTSRQFAVEQKEREAKQAQLDMPYPVAKYLGADYETDPAKKMMFDKAKELGIIRDMGGIPMVTGRDLPVFKQAATDDLAWTKQLNETRMQTIYQNRQNLAIKLPEAKKPEEAAAIKEQIAQLDDTLSSLAQAHLSIDNDYQAKAAIERLKMTEKPEFKIGANPLSSTGYSWYNLKEPEKPLQEAAPPSSANTEQKPPHTRTYDSGNIQITEEWRADEKGKYAWREVARSSRSVERPGESRRERSMIFNQERSMRKDFESLPEVKDYTELTMKYQRIKEAMAENKISKSKVAIDQALIMMYNKMMDSQSVVRESEYARTPQDMSWLNRMQGKIEKISKGGPGLTDEERNGLTVMAERFVKTATQMYEQRAEETRDNALNYGLNPDAVVFRKNAPSGGRTPAPGAKKSLDEIFKGKK